MFKVGESRRYAVMLVLSIAGLVLSRTLAAFAA
ncbi:MAG: hypothetical protein JWN72_2753 [Thermoleophilia bacterium]|nr:hypothetical protein [Thermoleophilia bacterium]